MSIKSYSKLSYTDIQNINWFVADTIRDKGNGRNEDTPKVAIPIATVKRFLDLREEYKQDIIYKSDEFEFENYDLLEVLPQFINHDNRFRVKSENLAWYDIEWTDIVNYKDNPDGDEIIYQLGSSDESNRVSINTSAKNKIEFLFETIESFENDIIKEFIEDYDFEKALIKVLKPEYINEILIKLGEYSFSEKNAPDDIFGDAYMDLTARFASEGGKKGGEFFTPSSLTRGGVYLLEPELKENKQLLIGDPTAGACTFMIYAGKEIESKSNIGKSEFNNKVKFITQEKEKNSEILGKLNMSFHGYSNHHSIHGNTITDWKGGHIGDYEGQMDYIWANPPYGLKDYGIDYADNNQGKENRWEYGVPKKGEGEYAFLESIINLLNENGKAVVILPLGTLFKDSTKDIRSRWIEDDIVEGIINLPSAMFLTTTIPVCMWIINKNKSEKDRGKVFMINAESEFNKDGKTNVWKGEKNELTVTNYLTREVEEGFSEYVDLETIRENGYNISVSRYVYVEDIIDEICIESLNNEINNLYLTMNDMRLSNKFTVTEG
jgi:type I restriction system adenine methylase HsdM